MLIAKQDQDRFWSKVARGGPLECWEYQAYRYLGYGRFQVAIGDDYRNHIASRVAFVITHGRLPVGLVRHSCDNRPCCNPAHLLEGSVQDNSNDAMERGRIARGEQNGRHVLTYAEVEDIRRLRRRGVLQRDVAKMFGVSRTAISAIDTGRNWARATRPLQVAHYELMAAEAACLPKPEPMPRGVAR